MSALIVLVVAASIGAYMLQANGQKRTSTTVEDEPCFDDESCAFAEFQDDNYENQGGTLSSAIVNVSCFPYEGANVKVYGADGEVVGAGTLGPAVEGASGCRYRYDIDVTHSDFYTVVVKDQEMFTLSAEDYVVAVGSAS